MKPLRDHLAWVLLYVAYFVASPWYREHMRTAWAEYLDCNKT